MAKDKTPWVPPDKDIQLFYNKVTELAGSCLSLKIAQTAAFTALRQPSAPWGDKPYGPSIIKTISAHFTPEQTNALNAHFGAPPTVKCDLYESKTTKLAENVELREHFLTMVAQGKSRPVLAAEFGLSMEMLPLALTLALKEIGRGVVKRGLSYKHGFESIEWFTTTIHQIADTKPEWASLKELEIVLPNKKFVTNCFGNASLDTVNSTEIYAHGWNEPPSLEEQDLYRQLMREKEPTSASGIDYDSLYSGGAASAQGSFAQRTAESLIGNGSTVKRRQ